MAAQQDILTTFRPAFEAAVAAFTSGDLDRTVAALPPDLEYHSLRQDPESAVHRGPDAVKHWVKRLSDFFEEWQVDVLDFEQPAPNAVLASYDLRGISRSARVPVEVHVFELWEFEGMRPVRARQFDNREAALAAL